MNNTASAEIKKYSGWTGFLNGKHVRVINKGVNTEGAPILKVKLGRYMGSVGWSGGCRPVYSYPYEPVWVLASKVETRAQLARKSSEPFD